MLHTCTVAVSIPFTSMNITYTVCQIFHHEQNIVNYFVVWVPHQIFTKHVCLSVSIEVSVSP